MRQLGSRTTESNLCGYPPQSTLLLSTELRAYCKHRVHNSRRAGILHGTPPVPN